MSSTVDTWLTGQTYILDFHMNTYLQNRNLTREVYALDDINKPTEESSRVIVNKHTSLDGTKIHPEGSYSNITKLRNKFIKKVQHYNHRFSRIEKTEVTVCIIVYTIYSRCFPLLQCFLCFSLPLNGLNY